VENPSFLALELPNYQPLITLSQPSFPLNQICNLNMLLNNNIYSIIFFLLEMRSGCEWWHELRVRLRLQF
jgi:hypothetical protein